MPAEPTKAQEQEQVTKAFKQAFGKLRDLGQQKLALEKKVAKAQAALEEQQGQLAKVQHSLSEAQREVDLCSQKYAEKVLQAQLEPALPNMAVGAAEAAAMAAKAQAEKQELEEKHLEREKKLSEIIAGLESKLPEEDRDALRQCLQEYTHKRRKLGNGEKDAEMQHG